MVAYTGFKGQHLFKKMARAIGSRDHKKCRSHHQKLKKDRTIQEIIQYLKEKIQDYSEIVDKNPTESVDPHNFEKKSLNDEKMGSLESSFDF